MSRLPKVLVVDDETDLLALGSTLLRKKGFEVHSLSNGADVVQTVLYFKPDLVVLDIKLGDYDGRKICRELRRTPLPQSVKIILHSAWPQFEKEYRFHGADDFILKPYSFDDLVAKIYFHLSDLRKDMNAQHA